ncbi:2-dehydro-3-deoxy-6-phosphogalactonate aldolase [Azospirillum sp. Marseille-Q6669]
MKDIAQAFEQAFKAMPLIAVLRGITPEEADPVFDAVVEAGVTLIEIPLNSPDALISIGKLAARRFPGVCIGAGTVLTAADVERVNAVGGEMIVTPNTEPAVIDAAVRADRVPVIGCLTPTEALVASRHGARVLKIFPAARLGAAYLTDVRAVLPLGSRLLAFGGVGLNDMAEYRAAGADGFGFGTTLYKPGRTARDVGAVARDLVAEWKRLDVAGG